MRWSVELRVDRPRDVGRQRRAPASNSSGSSQGLQGSSIPRWPGLGILGPSAAGSRTPGWRRSSVPASSVPTSSVPDPSVLGSSVPGSRVPGARILGSRLPGLWSSSISGLQHAATRALGVPGLSAASVRLRPLLALSPVSSQGQQTRLALTRHTSSLMLDSIPDVFSLKVLLEESGELFRIPSCRSDMTVRELKEQLDLVAGIPFNLQRLQYLDQEEPLPIGILMDESTLKYHDVDPGGVISLCIWQYDNWTELVLAAVEGDPSKLSCLGVSSEDSSAQTAQMQQLGPEAWRRWVEQRAFVALYITSHRGHLSAVKYLLEHGANCLGSTPLGRTALHVAAAMDRPKCILALLKHGASISQKDRYGETPMSLAHKLTQSSVQRRLFLSYWMTKCRALDSKSPDGQKAQPKATPKNRT